MFAVAAHRELLRIGTGGNFANEPALLHIDNCDAVRGMIGILVVVIVVFENWISLSIQFGRAFDRAAAHRNEQIFSIGTRVNAAGTFADGNSFDGLRAWIDKAD